MSIIVHRFESEQILAHTSHIFHPSLQFCPSTQPSFIPVMPVDAVLHAAAGTEVLKVAFGQGWGDPV
eukprot:754856-Hanusia_phi.AAC.1